MKPGETKSTPKRTRPPLVIGGLRDKKRSRHWLGEIYLFAPKPVVIATVRGKSVHEMRQRKRCVEEALRNLWRVGQTRRDEFGTWKCIGAIRGHVLVRRKGAAVHLMTERDWDALGET